MQNALSGRTFACAMTVALPAMTHADTISPDLPNAYFAPMAIIDDHPACNGAGQTAFQVAFETDDLSFQVSTQDLRSTARVDAAGNVNIAEERCYVIERHGTERIRVEIDCGGGQTRGPAFMSTDLERIAISVSGQFLACHSPMGFNVIDSQWNVAVTDGAEVADYSGAFIDFPVAGCQEARRVDGAAATLEYSLAGVSGTHMSSMARYWRSRQTRIGAAAPTFFRVGLSGVPLFADNGSTLGVGADTTVTIFPTLDGRSSCAGGVCTLPDWLRINRPQVTPLQCQ